MAESRKKGIFFNGTKNSFNFFDERVFIVLKRLSIILSTYIHRDICICIYIYRYLYTKEEKTLMERWIGRARLITLLNIIESASFQISMGLFARPIDN